ncbi:MAG: sigma-70 family RNA polymerase sigma factor [Ilumatobacter sp.]|uniref:sigma-70 family RNA polymerase sigma factor n=1 Tax=Ilumatobacter sp. TaxID=1967498 RepID=UPI002628695B|nr:sigma-70 family RNA polymerase sigma factor [Ilumatobacter sp.]MDJ0767447.1 sigma-70 family RNA polymerase sigma factor [Ilumatobacter sp.]
MTVLPQQHADSYRDGNTALFERRTELMAELRRCDEGDGEPSAATRRRVRRLRRALDDLNAHIVTYNIGLVRSYTRRFKGMASAEDREEYEAAGVLGLMRAVDSYDPDSGAFGQWAFKPIQREVLRAVRDVDHPNLNIGDFEKRPAILRAYRHLQGVDEAYTPSDAEVAAAAGVTVAQVRRVLAPPRVDSINQSIGDDNDTPLAETIESGEPAADSQVISKQTLTALKTVGLRALDARELYVIVRRFGLDGEPIEKLADIGESLALSREAVRQIEAKALAKLQHPLVLRKLNGPCDRGSTSTVSA